MISIIITTYKEPETLPRAIQAFLDERVGEEHEILVVGPDEETAKIAREFAQEHPEVRYLKDEGRGKPAALNLAFKKARGDILILTDGDVYIEKGAAGELLEPFEDSEVGAVSGRPVSISSRATMFGFWSHFLTQAAHQMRLRSKIFPCSGYLYAIRGGLIDQIPEEALSEDALITQMIRSSGYQVVYAPQAKVCVKYPDNFRDWLKQKVRATGGYIQRLKIKDSRLKNSQRARGFWQETLNGIKLFFTYPKNLREFWWTFLLYLARIYLWLAIFWNVKVRRKKFGSIWQRVESTK